MTVKELKDKIANMPDDMDVMIEQTNDESRYNMAHVAEERPVAFMDEEMDQSEWPIIPCLVITDEI